jgi:hypothetical protein
MDGEQRSPRADRVDRLVARTDGSVRVQLSAEIGVDFPVEVFDERGPGFVQPGTLGLTHDLEGDLIAWLRWWQQHVSPGGEEIAGGDDREWEQWSEEGRVLCERVQQELGGEFLVRFV